MDGKYHMCASKDKEESPVVPDLTYNFANNIRKFVMEVPNFSSLGKNARDVFMTGYHYGKGLMKLNVKTKSAKRHEMMGDGTLNFEALKLSGSMETRYKADLGTLLLKWTTPSVLFLGYEFNGLLMKDFDLLSEYSYNTVTAAKSVKLGSKFANESINARCEICNDLNSGMSFLGSIVVRCKDLFLGYRGCYDTALNRMTKNEAGLAFGYSDVDFHFRCTCIPYEYGLSLLYKARPDLDVAMNGIFARRGDVQKWTLGAAVKCNIDETSILRFKFNTDLQLGTSLSQRLSDNVALILSFNIDCANVTRGSHRVGLALNVEV